MNCFTGNCTYCNRTLVSKTGDWLWCDLCKKYSVNVGVTPRLATPVDAKTFVDFLKGRGFEVIHHEHISTLTISVKSAEIEDIDAVAKPLIEDIHALSPLVTFCHVFKGCSRPNFTNLDISIGLPKIDADAQNKLIAYVKKHNIIDDEGLMERVADMIEYMGAYAHTQPPSTRSHLRLIKLHVIQMLLSKGLARVLYRQTSYSGDSLVMFRSFDRLYHLREKDVGYLEVVQKAPMNTYIEPKRIVEENEIDMEFLTELDWISCLNNPFFCDIWR